MLEFPLFWKIEHIFIGYQNLLQVLPGFVQVSSVYGYINDFTFYYACYGVEYS